MKKLLFICFLSILSCQYSSAQAPHFRNYTVDDGLPSSHVYRAFQDSKGFMWFCTDKGIARFDGYKFEKFTTKNGLPNNDVWHCAEDRNGRIWFLSYANAFFYFDLKDDKFHVIDNPFKDNHDAHIWCYVQESNGIVRVELSSRKAIIWLDVKKNYIRKYKKVSNEDAWKINQYPMLNNISFKYGIKTTKVGKRNSQWLVRAYSESLQHNILHKPHIVPKINRINDFFWLNTVSVIFEDDKTIYATNDSISFFKNDKFYTKHIDELSSFPNDDINLILSTGDRDQKLVVTEKDIFVIDKNLNRKENLNFIKSFSLNTLFLDSERNTWLCTKNSGVYLLSEGANNSKTYPKLSNRTITTIIKDKQNGIWVGTNKGEIYNINKNNELRQCKFPAELSSPIKSMDAYSSELAICWEQSVFTIIPFRKINSQVTKSISLPIYSFSNQKILKYKDKINCIINSPIKTMRMLSDSVVLTGSTGEISIIKNTKYAYTIQRILNGTKVLSLKDVSNQIYAGTNKGLIKIDFNGNQDITLKTIKQKYTILSKPISSFESDNQKTLWVGTDGYGVYRLSNNVPKIIPELEGIIVNHLYFEKENNRLFISTNEGIYILKLTIKGADFTHSIQRISLAQGLPTLEVNGSVVRNQELFMATSKGLAVLPLIGFGTKTTAAKIPLIIKNIKINRRDTTVSSFYNLTYQQNNIDFDFVALSYKSDKNIKYDYKLLSNNSNDTTWHPTEDLHKEFSLLPPGKYEFHLRAFDIEGIATQTIKPIVFVINPPFWQTLWFKLLIIFVILSAIILFFYLRTKNIQKKEQERTEINKKFAELELQALQAQMNPHFVFNALSAIQNFILNNNTEEATDYLSKFSRLMRLFLESSRNKYISLRDEKLLLEYYIQLEKLRFSGKFTYQFIIDGNVGLDTEIPSMLLQPFIENAINHGLIYKENNEGKLTITFTMENQKLICEIDDNGIGRQKAAEIKNQSLKPYKSRGTEITEERLRSLELIENTKIEVMINDKIDENNVAKGTKVIIVMYL